MKKVLLLALIVVLSGCTSLMKSPEAPSVSLAGIKFVSANIFEQRFAIQLRLQNPNDFALPIRGLDYKIMLAGNEFANGVSANSIKLPALGEDILELETTTNALGLYKQFQSLTGSSGKPISYGLTGNLNVLGASIKLPFSKTGEVTF